MSICRNIVYFLLSAYLIAKNNSAVLINLRHTSAEKNRIFVVIRRGNSLESYKMPNGARDLSDIRLRFGQD